MGNKQEILIPPPNPSFSLSSKGERVYSEEDKHLYGKSVANMSPRFLAISRHLRTTLNIYDDPISHLTLD